MAENTISVGICDDDKYDLTRIETTLRKGLQKLDIFVNAEFRSFLNGEDLYDSSLLKAFDLLFLDIEMPGTNGFQLAKRIHLANPLTNIIFVSVHESLVFDSQEYSPLWFVRKKALEKDSLLALQKYLETKLPEQDFYTAGSFTCPLRDILYIESMGHLLSVRRTNGKIFEQYGSLKAMEAALSGRGFLRTHKSYIVNQRYIEEINRKDIRLTDGTILEIGRDRRKFLLEAMRQYEGKHYGLR